MTLPAWKRGDTAWDALVLAGIRLPGQWYVEVSPSRKVQVKEAKGEDGNTLEDNGYKGMSVKGTGRLWTDEQVQEFYRLVPLFHPRSLGGASNPVTIVHPVATLWGLKAIYCPKWRTKSPDAEFLQIQFDALEWFPGPEPVAPKPTGTGPGGNGSTPATPEEDEPFNNGPPPVPNPRFKGGKVGPS